MGNLKSLLQPLSITLKRIRLNHKRERQTGLTGEERNIELFRQDSILYDAHDLVEAIGSNRHARSLHLRSLYPSGKRQPEDGRVTRIEFS